MNLQALIDREIILDSMLQNFTKGESVTELSIQLWYLICDIDIASDLSATKPAEESKNQIMERMEDLKDLEKQSVKSLMSVVDHYQNPYEEYLPDRRFKRQVAISIKLQMLTSRLCGFFDEVIVLEKIRGRNDVTPLFKNILEYSYRSHLVLCAVVLDRVPESTKSSNVSSLILQSQTFLNLEMGLVPQRNPRS